MKKLSTFIMKKNDADLNNSSSDEFEKNKKILQYLRIKRKWINNNLLSVKNHSQII